MLWTERVFDLEVRIPGSSAEAVYAYIRAMGENGPKRSPEGTPK